MNKDSLLSRRYFLDIFFKISFPLMAIVFFITNDMIMNNEYLLFIMNIVQLDFNNVNAVILLNSNINLDLRARFIFNYSFIVAIFIFMFMLFIYIRVYLCNLNKLDNCKYQFYFNHISKYKIDRHPKYLLLTIFLIIFIFDFLYFGNLYIVEGTKFKGLYCSIVGLVFLNFFVIFAANRLSYLIIESFFHIRLLIKDKNSYIKIVNNLEHDKEGLFSSIPRYFNTKKDLSKNLLYIYLTVVIVSICVYNFYFFNNELKIIVNDIFRGFIAILLIPLIIIGVLLFQSILLKKVFYNPFKKFILFSITFFILTIIFLKIVIYN